MDEEKKVVKKNKHPFLTILGAIFLILIIVAVINNLKTSAQNYTSTPTIENRTFVIQKGYVHQECWNSTENLSVSIIIDSTKPVDIYFVPSQNDVSLLINNSQFVSYPSCHSPQVLKDNINCVIDGKGCLVISNANGLEDSQIDLSTSVS